SLLPSDIHVNSIAETDNGTIWVGTQNLGIFRIDGEGTNPRSYTIKHYCPAEGNLNSAMVTVVYNDASGRLWVGTDGSGLSLYDYDGDSFMPVHVKWNLPGDMISSILGDSRGNLWIGTNMGLINLKMSGDTSHANYRVYTATNGAQDNIFNRNAAAIDSQGRMVFGGPRGLNILTSDFRDSEIARMPVTITGLEVFGTSWYRMPEDVRNAVSELSPGYTECVTLRHDQNNFSIDFSVLDYVSHPVQHKYAYRMDGFDNDWHTTDMSRRFAYYNNLPPGEYLFRVKASDAEGRWMDQERLLRVDIRPPFWATWWAKCIYFAVFCAIAAAAFRISRRRVIKSNALHLRELELAQAEEMNKTRLRFFTNITHEWLTPLSIISAVAEEMKGSTPEQQDNHRIMTASINRLSRMLQQVLEFRKAETGNLRLRVS
ncbi:MAG: hybrid sensor histidine kinase/response regulator, partial [Muribaculaceae bacterium]|nr:hybrid sensor histidine kinase/response regulator [Muribaculaceae bacterium]